MKLSIRQMIDSGSWFRCEGERKTQFRMRITAFRPVYERQCKTRPQCAA